MRRNNNEKCRQKEHVSALRTGERKHSMFLAGLQDADMHQGITMLDKTRLCASLKLTFPWV